MKSLFLLVSLVLYFSATVTAKELIVQNITLVSAHLAEPKPHYSVRVSDGLITEISPAPLKPREPFAVVIQGDGQFLSPGIMDSHIHSNTIPGVGYLATPQADKHANLVADYLTQLPKSLLYYGITQVLNMGGNEGEAQFKQAPQHPDYFTCQPIPVIGGYPHFSADYTFKHARYFILEAEQTYDLPDGIDPSRHTAKAVIADIAAAGAPCIKIYVEDGFGAASHWPLQSSATLNSIRNEASIHNIQVWAHANAIDMFQIALTHHVDGLAHGLWNWQWPANPDQPPVTETLDTLINSHTAYMPTIQVMLSLQGMYDDKTLTDTRREQVLPHSLLNWYTTEEGQWFKREITRDFGDLPEATVFELTGYGVSRAQRAAAYVANQGYPLILGSDYPSSPSYAAAPGLSTYYEMQKMAEAGITAGQIFDAATINGPLQFDMADRYGTIETGKIANLLILDKNPQQAVEHWQSIKTVILHGEVIARETLAVNPE
ncbi:amidohydrolase family protein [Alteromonas lipolytica]|uniref:Amidohydrolase-related domain-containing protein n=1 Tax=Alteromonas lipolytica TaxID=1856405 RepID=A0A1E8FGX1_9ALTE|nr:amidohydrolase family protein [Alteromonas lipolytica]OFI35180.1 hypothetical protein BFC17_16695 [Alteromonas lipolytica]GGF57377.1 hypothetical protein GCM10011338_07050 [Alteromonas lipolytica]